jgi:hypothetical protein
VILTRNSDEKNIDFREAIQMMEDNNRDENNEADADTIEDIDRTSCD